VELVRIPTLRILLFWKFQTEQLLLLDHFAKMPFHKHLYAASTGGTWSGTGITNAATGSFGAVNTPAGNYSITYTTPGQCSHVFNQTVQVIENLDSNNRICRTFL